MRSGTRSCAQGRRGYDNSARSRARLRRILRRLSVHREEDADQDRGPLRAWLCERHDATPPSSRRRGRNTRPPTSGSRCRAGSWWWTSTSPKARRAATISSASSAARRRKWRRRSVRRREAVGTFISASTSSLQLVQTTITSSLDVRIGGLGYVIAPSPGNGRHWIQPLLSTPLMEAPQWLLERLRRPPEPEPGEAKPFVGETSARAQEALERACAALAVGAARDSRRYDRPGRLSRRQAGGGGRARR